MRTNDVIKKVLRTAAKEGRQVSVRGTKHSMGGHTIAPGTNLFGNSLNYILIVRTQMAT